MICSQYICLSSEAMQNEQIMIASYHLYTYQHSP